MSYTTEQLVSRWEDHREIKNLMGKLSNMILLNREGEIFEKFWADSEEVCLAFNDGYYKGRAGVSGYYAATRARNMLVASLLRDRFPEELGGKSDGEVYGIGPFKVYPMYTPVIEIAADGETAKGLWYCAGAKNEVGASGPVAHWTWGYFAADYVREGEVWKILHLQIINDIDCIAGQSWGRPQVPYPELPEFAPLKAFKYPAYTESARIRAPYSPSRPLTGAPEPPRPYGTFSETFSYGF